MGHKMDDKCAQFDIQGSSLLDFTTDAKCLLFQFPQGAKTFTFKNIVVDINQNVTLRTPSTVKKRIVTWAVIATLLRFIMANKFIMATMSQMFGFELLKTKLLNPNQTMLSGKSKWGIALALTMIVSLVAWGVQKGFKI